MLRNATLLATDTGSNGTYSSAGARQNWAIGGSLTFADDKGRLVVQPIASFLAGSAPYPAAPGSTYDTPSIDFWNMPISGFQAGDPIVADVAIPSANFVLYSYSIGPLSWDAGTKTATIDLVTTDNFSGDDGHVLIPAKHLQDGRTVRQVERDRITYYRLELDRHDVVFAEGLPVETFLDTGRSAAFAADGGRRLSEPGGVADRVAGAWETQGYAPLAICDEAVARAWENLSRANPDPSDDLGSPGNFVAYRSMRRRGKRGLVRQTTMRDLTPTLSSPAACS